jgi:dienelactone hydrolase
MYGWPGAFAQGYRMDNICEALAKEGYLTFLPIREKRARGKNHSAYEEYYKDVVSHALDYVKSLTDVDPARVALMGFSMGGFTSLKVAVERKDLKALLLLAPATAHGLMGEAAKNVGSLNTPVLLLVEASDEGHILKGAANLEQALQKHGKKARVIRYDRGGGHKLFYTVDYYWPDVRAFLHENLGG